MAELAVAIFQKPTRLGASNLLASAGLPVADLTDEHMHAFFYTGSAAAPDALVGVEVYGGEALLRSLVVAEPLRSSGIGRTLVARAEVYAREQGASEIYLLTTTAERFFSTNGYLRAPREKAPPSIRSTPEFAELCPVSSAFMLKRL
jgi:amino-acid N-acetyltransferase